MHKPIIRLSLVFVALALIGAGCYKKATNATNQSNANAAAGTTLNNNSALNETLNANASVNANAAINQNANATTNVNAATLNANTGSANANTGASTAVENKSVAIEGSAFSPASLTVKKGAKVTWTNQDSFQHTVTVDSGSGPASGQLSQGQSYSYTFNTVGVYSYHCADHSFMTATVTVTE